MHLKLLSEYELGRLVTFIEWVGRGPKPIAECSSRILNRHEMGLLRRDLRAVLSLVGEPGVFGYILRLGEKTNWHSFGVARYEWALMARISWKGHQAPWVEGTLFGYSPGAIDRFIESGESKPNSRPYGTCGKVEIVRSCLRRSRNRSKAHDRFQIAR